MARCFWILRISLGEIYHRLRRASLRIRSCMTSFLKRFRRLSCDSPSLKDTVANTLTSFLLPDNEWQTICAEHRKPGLRIQTWMAAGLYDSGGGIQPSCLLSGSPTPGICFTSQAVVCRHSSVYIPSTLLGGATSTTSAASQSTSAAHPSTERTHYNRFSSTRQSQP